MDFPIFFLPALAVTVLLIVTVVVYFQVYKRNKKMALETNAGTHASLTPWDKTAILLTIVVFIAGIVISYFVGYKTAYDTYEESLSQASNFDIQTYYAEIKEIDSNSLLVEGISLNDEDHRSEFRYDVPEGTKLEWHNTPIGLSDLNEGDLISITLVVDRTGVTDIFKIQLLDDGK